MNETRKPDYFYEVMRNITALGSAPTYILLLLFVVATKEYLLFSLLTLGMIILLLGVVATRLVYPKSRPQQQEHSNILEKIDASAFPSWHTAQTVFISLALLFKEKSVLTALLLGIIVILVAYSRIYLKKHDFYDILGGIGLGLATYIIVQTILF